MEGITAFPLAWPMGWPRSPELRQENGHGRFARGAKGWSFAAPRDALVTEIGRLKGKAVVLSSNFPLRRDGLPLARTGRIADEGVAIYFMLDGRQMAMACDRFTRAEHNMRSLTLAIEALRQLERHGGGTMMERAFAGFAALPAPGSARPWNDILGVPPNASRAEINAAFRAKAASAHPDTGGSHEAMAALTAARDAGFKAVAS